jgi:hypothetical protein
MLNSTQAMRLRTSFPGIVDANKAIVAVSYLAAYVALDWVSFVEPYAWFNITPWNQNAGLSFIFNPGVWPANDSACVRQRKSSNSSMFCSCQLRRLLHCNSACRNQPP